MNVGGKSKKQLKEELGLKQTIHSAAGALIKALTEGKGLGEVRTAEQLKALYETLVVKLDVELRPIRPVRAPLRDVTWLDRRRGVDAADRAATSRRHELGGRQVVAYAQLAGAAEDGTLVGLELQAEYLVPDYGEEFCRRATVIGQVIRVTQPNERLVATSLGAYAGTRLTINDPNDRGPDFARAIGAAPPSSEHDHAAKARWPRSLFAGKRRRKPILDQAAASPPAALIDERAAPIGAELDVEHPSSSAATRSDNLPQATQDDAPEVRISIKPLCIYK